MNKRNFIKTGVVGTVGLMSMPVFGKKVYLGTDQMNFQVPDLPYAYDALEPFIDAETMQIHHLKHHAGYAAKLNAALNEAGVSVKFAPILLKEASKYSPAITNNAGGFVNHNIFWKCLSPEGIKEPTGIIADRIEKDFGSFINFKTEFSHAAGKHFGSGWAWLIITAEDKLKIVTTSNQDNPVMDTLPDDQKGRTLLCLDLWEHAYYLKYQNRRGEYIDAFWNIVNWEFANNKLAKISKA